MFRQPRKRKPNVLHQSRDGRIAVVEHDFYGNDVRSLIMDDTGASAAFVEEGRHYELVYDYMKCFERVFTLAPAIRETLMIGGAGFSFAKYYISHYPDKRMDVVEMDWNMVDLAMEYFYLDELVEEYRLHETKRLSIYIDEGQRFLERRRKKYNAIINDAYVGSIPDKGLLSARGVSLLHERLHSDGIYALNLISALSGTLSMPAVLAYETLRRHFRYVSMKACTEGIQPTERQNCLLLASDEIPV